MRPTLALSLLGVAAGILSGIFGVGGGFIIVPGLVLFFNFKASRAAGTSLAAVLPISLVSVLSYLLILHGNVDFMVALLVAAGGVFGSVIGVQAIRSVHNRRHVKLLSILLVGIGILMVFPVQPNTISLPADAPALLLAGVLCGLLSGFFGIGGAVILLPLLTMMFGLPFQKAAPIFLLAIVIISLASLRQHLKMNHVDRCALERIIPPAIAAALVTPYFSVQAPNALLHSSFGVLMLLYAVVLYLHARKLQK
ncbi:MAG TPA: sulfite exporter TauE/SafE family protein, partial [Candidatus Norongarragalinales archaeon]|nr:sulfite exporter TauE/SafE family protein [Candidatus Norongarragalinales archaeon]